MLTGSCSLQLCATVCRLSELGTFHYCIIIIILLNQAGNSALYLVAFVCRFREGRATVCSWATALNKSVWITFIAWWRETRKVSVVRECGMRFSHCRFSMAFCCLASYLPPCVPYQNVGWVWDVLVTESKFDDWQVIAKSILSISGMLKMCEDGEGPACVRSAMCVCVCVFVYVWGTLWVCVCACAVSRQRSVCWPRFACCCTSPAVTGRQGGAGGANGPEWLPSFSLCSHVQSHEWHDQIPLVWQTLTPLKNFAFSLPILACNPNLCTNLIWFLACIAILLLNEVVLYCYENVLTCWRKFDVYWY